MIPRVKISVSEDTNNYYTTNVNFVPTVIIKAMSGNIGTKEVIHSEAEFVSMFGKGNESTPAAYALQCYLRTYSFINVTRVASSSADFGSATISTTIEETATELVGIKTNYKTESFNGVEVALVYDAEAKKLFMSTKINGSTVNSVKENFDVSTATAVDLSNALDVITTSFNAMNLGITLTNKFINKIATDPTVTDFTNTKVNIASGNSGLTGITPADVKNAINIYATSEESIDLLSIPEFNDDEVIQAAVKAAEDYNFLFITSPNTNDINECLTIVNSYPKSESLAIYYPNVKYNGFNATIPASVAVLNAFAKNDNINKWLSPAGTNRGLLTLVTDTDSNIPTVLSDASLTSLYDNVVPVNPIKFVPGVGYAIWGQKTTATSDIYMDRLNISRLVKYVYREVYKISSDYLFEPINSNTFTLWKLRVEELLANIKTNQGIDAYSYKMDEENNTEETISNNQLIGEVRIKPTEVAEYIDIDFVLTSQV